MLSLVYEFLDKTVVITLENGEKSYMEKTFRHVPICVTHSTETTPFTRGQMQFLDATSVYHAALLYKEVNYDE